MILKYCTCGKPGDWVKGMLVTCFYPKRPKQMDMDMRRFEREAVCEGGLSDNPRYFKFCSEKCADTFIQNYHKLPDAIPHTIWTKL